MTVTHKPSSPLRLPVLAVTLALAAVTLIQARPAAAQLFAQDRGPVQRVVHGKVEDKNGAAIKGAVVYLQNGRDSSVKSAITDTDGTYRFVQLTQNTDYELWAKADGKKSKTRAISSFDTKNDFTLDLKIDQ